MVPVARSVPKRPRHLLLIRDTLLSLSRYFFLQKRFSMSTEPLATETLFRSGENDGSLSPVAPLGRQVGAALLAEADTTPIWLLGQWFVSSSAILVPSGDQETSSSVLPRSATTTLGRPPPMG